MPPVISAAAEFGIAYRPETDADRPFLAALYASTRSAEVSGFGWPEDMQRTFLAQQHDAQHRHFRAAYPVAEWLIVERAGRPVGRLYLDRRDTAIHIIDIALLPECRGAGLGGAILSDVAAQAGSEGLNVSLRVEQFNPAIRLYERIGFRPTGDDGVYRRMELTPSA